MGTLTVLLIVRIVWVLSRAKASSDAATDATADAATDASILVLPLRRFIELSNIALVHVVVIIASSGVECRQPLSVGCIFVKVASATAIELVWQ